MSSSVNQAGRKRLFVFAGLVLATAFAWSAFEWWASLQPSGVEFTEEERRRIAGVPEAPVRPAEHHGPIRLAIGPLGLNDKVANDTVADLVVARLSGDRDFELVERRDFARIMQEFQLGAIGAIRPADAVKLGRLLKADWLVLGSAYRAGAEPSTVVRVVDSSTGIIRSLSVLQGASKPVQAAETLTALLRRLRSGTTESGDLPQFIAVGGFEDLSVRPRHAGVEAELRSHLMSVLAGGRMIVLERELTRLLFDEIRMQQAGLIDSTNPVPRVQSTFWLVDGFWQSFDSVGDEIDLTLRVSRIGGTTARRSLRALRGDPLGEKAASAMGELVRALPEPARPATRKGEIRVQMAAGLERSGLEERDLDALRWYRRLAYLPWNETPATTARRRENYLVAMQAFESVLLLDPDDPSAKLYLARCLVDTSINRPMEAIDLYRELVGHKHPRISWMARDSLGFAYLLHGEESRAVEWFRGLLATSPEDYRPRAQFLLDRVIEHVPEDVSSAESVAGREREERLLRDVRKWREAALAGKWFSEGGEISRFVDGRTGGREEGIKHLLEMLPKLAAEAPELKPHLLLRAIRNNKVTNSPVLGELDRVLESVARDPNSITRPEVFLFELGERLEWVGYPALYQEMALVADALAAGKKAGLDFDLSAASQVRMGYAYIMVKRWEDALATFQGVTNQVVAMNGSGPWGTFPVFIAPRHRVNQCLKELGRPEVVDPELIPVPDAVTKFSEDFLFLPDGLKLRVLLDNRLVELREDGSPITTNFLGGFSKIKPRVMVQSADALWIGTACAGLIRLDKATKQTRQFTTTDGLLFNDIESLYLDGETLWIGCEDEEKRGGVCRLDIASSKIRSFTPTLGKAASGMYRGNWADEDDLNAAPRRPVRALAMRGKGELLAGVFGVGLQRHDPAAKAWSTMVRRENFPSVECLAVSDDWTVMGESPSPLQDRDTRLLTILQRNSTNVLHLGPADGLPYAPVSTLALDGDRLWVGGPGYLAIMDLRSRKILKRCLVNIASASRSEIEDNFKRRAFEDTIFRRAVSQLAIDDDKVWVRIGRSIGRFPRALGREN